MVNVTVNGGEPDVIESLGIYLDKVRTISFPLMNRRTLASGILEKLAGKGFEIYVSDSRPRPMEEAFWVALATRNKSLDFGATVPAHLLMHDDGRVEMVVGIFGAEDNHG